MMNRVDFLANEPHFIFHLAPVYNKLHPDIKGRFYVPEELTQHAKFKNVEPTIYKNQETFKKQIRFDKSIVAAASWGDLKRIQESNRTAILFEHGTGQTYSNRHASYAGGRGREKVRLFLCPNELVAQKNRQSYPGARIEVIGCPKMDEFYLKEPKPISNPPVIAVSFHWECNVCPETKSGFPYFAEAVLKLAKKYKVLGHSHPRYWNVLGPWYKANGIERIWNFEEILNRADVYCIDNSSTLFEFASINRPVVVLNPPWYRRDVNHGLRFWEYSNIGVYCNDPGDLIKCVEKVLADPPTIQKRRHEINDILYPVRDGSAAQKAADAIAGLFK
jgi:hypothetical protein